MKPAKKTNRKPTIEKDGFWRWFWWFIWDDNSIWSWIVNIILAFVIIKFVAYPGLGFLLGTNHPIVAVVSGSMEHDGASFDEWWAGSCCVNNRCSEIQGLYADHGITKEDFSDFPFRNGFNKGDMMVLTGPEGLEVGDIAVFAADGLGEPIIHRVVEINDEGIVTKGDHNCGSGSFEKNIQESQLIGKAGFRLPLLGWLKIGFVNLVSLIIN